MDFRAVFAWSWLPHVLAALVLIACTFAFQGGMLRPSVLIPVSVGVIALSLWSFVLAVRMTGAVQGFGTVRSIVNALMPTLVVGLLALAVRIFLCQPFNVPAGSMQPTLMIGDYFYADKLAYGLSRYSFPLDASFKGRFLQGDVRRGDIVVFALPRDPSAVYVKRVVGIPGDSIALEGGVLVINGVATARVSAGTFTSVDSDGHAERIPAFTETLPGGPSYTVLERESDGPFDGAGPFQVPAGHYFVLGDNRDNSADSRSPQVGFVPADNLIGRASLIFFSAAEIVGPIPIARAFDNVRWDRIGLRLH